MVMLVSAIEALSVPNAPWDGSRKVARFISFVLQAAPETVNQILGHRNFQAAFRKETTSPRKFLNDLYSRRSRPLHSGFLQHNVQGALGDFTGAPMRVAMASGLVRDCISSFLKTPFSSLTGHPTVDPNGKKSCGR